MNSDYPRMLSTFAQGYAAWFAASAEIGVLAVRAGAAESGHVAEAAADALRAPEPYHTTAAENVMRCAYDAQARQLRSLRGASALWNIAFLRHFDAARRP